MGKRIQKIYHSLISRLIVLVGLFLLVVISTWAYFNIDYQKNSTIENIVEEVDRLGNTIKLGTHYAMMLNSRDDINEIINNIGRQERIENIRIFNKQGQIKYSNRAEEVDRATSIKAEACAICHKKEPPLEAVDIRERTRIFPSPGGYRLIGVISPIYNEPSCSTDACHVHPRDKKVLGALDVVISLENTDKGIRSYERRIILLAGFSFLATSTIILAFLFLFVNRPIKRLIGQTRLIGTGKFDGSVATESSDEIGQLAVAIEQMGKDISRKQEELNKQRNEYQELFEQVPCAITVQDRELRLLQGQPGIFPTVRVQTGRALLSGLQGSDGALQPLSGPRDLSRTAHRMRARKPEFPRTAASTTGLEERPPFGMPKATSRRSWRSAWTSHRCGAWRKKFASRRKSTGIYSIISPIPCLCSIAEAS